jgi:hypothetical protein
MISKSSIEALVLKFFVFITNISLCLLTYANKLVFKIEKSVILLLIFDS